MAGRKKAATVFAEAAKHAREQLPELYKKRDQLATEIANFEAVAALVPKEQPKPARGGNGATAPNGERKNSKLKPEEATAVLKDAPGGLTVQDLAVALEKKFGRPFKPNSLKAMLKRNVELFTRVEEGKWLAIQR